MDSHTRTLNVTPSLVMTLSECDHPRAGLLQNTLSVPPVAPSILLCGIACTRKEMFEKVNECLSSLLLFMSVNDLFFVIFLLM